MYLVKLSVQPGPGEELPPKRGARHRRTVESEVNSSIVQIRSDDLFMASRVEYGFGSHGGRVPLPTRDVAMQRAREDGSELTVKHEFGLSDTHASPMVEVTKQPRQALRLHVIREWVTS